MGILLNKEIGISLKKESSLRLEKNKKALQNVCIGLNWGAIKKKMLFGLITDTENVDLDGSVTTFDNEGKELETVYYNKLKSSDKAIIHSGDDTKGNTDGDDGLDNEVIQIYLNRVSKKVDQIVFYLNSYQKQDFADIPYSKIRIFEETKYKVKDVFATFHLSAQSKYKGYTSMVLGKLVRKNHIHWEFKAIGEPVSSKRIDDTIEIIKEKYL